MPWSFRVVRGQVASEVLAAAPQADLLILGNAGRSLIGRTVGSAARAVAARPCRSLLFVERGSSFGPAILAVYDGSTGSHQALSAAIRVAQVAEKPLTVLIAIEGRTGPHGCKRRPPLCWAQRKSRSITTGSPALMCLGWHAW